MFLDHDQYSDLCLFNFLVSLVSLWHCLQQHDINQVKNIQRLLINRLYWCILVLYFGSLYQLQYTKQIEPLYFYFFELQTFSSCLMANFTRISKNKITTALFLSISWCKTKKNKFQLGIFSNSPHHTTFFILSYKPFEFIFPNETKCDSQRLGSDVKDM